MPGHRLQHEPQIDTRPLPSSGIARRAGSPLIEAALDLQRRAGNRSVAELVGGGAAPLSARGGGVAAVSGGSVGVQREPCTDCPDADVPLTPDAAELPEPGAGG